MSKRGKVWGDTVTSLSKKNVHIETMRILPNSRCSMHLHETKCNAFLVGSGTLKIFVEKNDYPLTDVTTLEPGDVMEVAPGEYHRFETGDEPVLAFEMYYLHEPLVSDVPVDDIKRKDHGGPVVQPYPDGRLS
jgi:mannose-6-phosphate isomerase-like protein (cupin superfamily)